MQKTSRIGRASAAAAMLVAGVSCNSSGAEQRRIAAPSSLTAPGPVTALTQAATASRTEHVAVKALSGGHSIHGSSATLKRQNGGLTAKVHTRELNPGESVDVLWAIFNHPEACTNPNPMTGAACSPPDLFVAGTAASLHYVAALTADGHGKLAYSASLDRGSSAACLGAPYPCNTLTNPIGAEVHSAMFAPDGGAGRQAAQFYAP